MSLVYILFWAAQFFGYYSDAYSQRISYQYISLQNSRQIVGDVLIISLCLFAILWQCLIRRTAQTVFLFALAIVSPTINSYFWSYDFLRSKEEESIKDALPKEFSGKLNSSELLVTETTDRFGEGKPRDKVYLGKIELQGLRPGQFAIAQGSYDAMLFSQNGMNTTSSPGSLALEDKTSLSHWTFAKAFQSVLPGVLLVNSRPGEDQYREVFRLRASAFDSKKGMAGRYLSEMSFDIFEYHESLRLPLHVGTIAFAGDQQMEVYAMTAEPNGVLVTIREREMNLYFDTWTQKHFWFQRMLEGRYSRIYVIRNLKTNEGIVADEGTAYDFNRVFSSYFGQQPRLFSSAKRLVFSGIGTAPGETRNLDQDWFNNTELIRLDARQLGTRKATIKAETFTLVPESTVPAKVHERYKVIMDLPEVQQQALQKQEQGNPEKK